MLDEFNDSDAIVVISPFYTKNDGDFRGYSIARYSNLLINSFSKNQKVVVFCEKRESQETPFQISENVLVVPTYKFNSLGIFGQIMTKVNKFKHIKNYLVQFEFSIYGGKKVIPAFLTLFFVLKILGKNTSLVLHQVVSNLNDLSGHLGLSRDSFRMGFFNKMLKTFYSVTGFLVNKVIVHDLMLKNRLSEFMNEDKILIIPHAIGDLDKRPYLGSKSAARKSFGLKLKDKVVGVYGYRSWYKGTDWIIQTVRQIALQYPGKNIKLLVAGGVSPTLKHTDSYKRFDRRIRRVIKAADGSVVVTGFVPEKDVWKVFGSCDVMIFPYRTRMSASGAFSLALAYKKPFLVSKPFANGMDSSIQKVVFDLNTFSFEQKLLGILESNTLRKSVISAGEKLCKSKSWENIANLYLTSIKNDTILVNTKDETEKSFVFFEA